MGNDSTRVGGRGGIIRQPERGTIPTPEIHDAYMYHFTTPFCRFYFNVSAAIRAAEAALGAPPRLALFEPITWDNFVPVGFDALPGAEWGAGGSPVLAPFRT